MTALHRVWSVMTSLLAGLAGACSGGGGSTGSGSVDGTVHGQPFTIDDAISASVTATIGSITAQSALIVMANVRELCSDAGANISRPNERGVSIQLANVDGTTSSAPTAPGTYTIAQNGTMPPPRRATLIVSVDDAACKGIKAQSASATSGTVTLTGVSGNKFSGNFDVMLDSGDQVTGRFAPGDCPGLNVLLNDPPEPSCM